MSSDRTLPAACAALLFALAACDTPTVESAAEFAYDPTSLTGGLLYRWDAGREIAVFVDRTAEPADADLETAVREAMANWNAVGQLGEIRLRTTSDLRSADVIIHHAAAPRLVTSGACEPIDIGSGGYTFFCVDDDLNAVTFELADGTGGRVKMDVAINRDAVASYDIFKALVAHELGHVLGIGTHSSDTADLMNGSPRRLAPSSADRQTLRYVLAQRPDVRF